MLQGPGPARPGSCMSGVVLRARWRSVVDQIPTLPSTRAVGGAGNWRLLIARLAERRERVGLTASRPRCGAARVPQMGCAGLLVFKLGLECRCNSEMHPTAGRAVARLGWRVWISSFIASPSWWTGRLLDPTSPRCGVPWPREARGHHAWLLLSCWSFRRHPSTVRSGVTRLAVGFSCNRRSSRNPRRRSRSRRGASWCRR